MPFLLQAPIKIVYIALLTICMVLKAATMELAFIVKKLILGMTLAAPIGPVSVKPWIPLSFQCKIRGRFWEQPVLACSLLWSLLFSRLPSYF